MFKTIKNKFNKTPTQNTSMIVRRIEHIDMSVLELLLASELLGEGIYGLEVESTPEHAQNLLFTPSVYREEIGAECYANFEHYKNDLSNTHCYNIVLANPSFLPLYTKQDTSFLHNLSLLQSDSTSIASQTLFTQRNDNWQQEMIGMYAEYLNGNEFPSNSRAGRKVQSALLSVLNKVSGFQSKKSEISEISEKILDNCYRFEQKIMVLTENIEVFEQELDEILKEHDFFNQLVAVKVKNKKQFLNDFIDRRYSDYSKNQMVSEKEMISLLVDDFVHQVEQPITIAEVQEKIKAEVITSSVVNIDLLPSGVKKERKIDHELVKSLPVALKKAKAIKESKVEILDIELGATVQRITFKIPKGIVYSDIKNKHEDVRNSLGEELSIIQGNEPNTVTFLIPCKQRDVIYLKELLENEEFQQFAAENPLPFCCGVDMYNQLVMKCLTNAPHILVTGATNSGKSVFVNALLITLILMRSPSELRLFLIDPKKVEFMQYKGFAHVEDVITEMDKAIKTLDQIIVEMESRYDKFSKIGVRKISAYNIKSKSKLPYVICAIDEYNDLRMVYPEVESRIERLGQKARAAGIHLIIATQRPDKDVMSGVIKTNLPSRVSFKLDNSNEYRTVFGTGIPYKNLLGFGDGVIKFVGQVEEFVRFQAPVITLDENEEEKTFENIKKAYKGEQVEKIELAEIVEENELDKLKKIIAETEETRVGKLREIMKIRSNDLQELMKQLVDEGWLEEPTSKAKGYQLIISGEELDKWRE